MGKKKLSLKAGVWCNCTVAEVQKFPFNTQMNAAEDLLGRITDELADLGFDLTALADAVECVAVGYRCMAQQRPDDASLQ
jgi:hypothetical protein